MIRNAIKDIIIALLMQDGNISANMLFTSVGITGKLFSKFKASGDFSGSLLRGK